MKTRLLKKTAALLLALALLAALLPGAALAAPTVKLVNSVAITDVTYPVAGQHPSYVASVANNGAGINTDYDDPSAFFQDGVRWKDKTEGVYLAPTSVFEAGHDYALTLDVIASAGFQFPVVDGQPKVTASVNASGVVISGAEANRWPATDIDPKDEIYFVVGFKLADAQSDPPITSVTVEVKEPVADGGIDFSPAVVEPGLSIKDVTVGPFYNGVAWRDETAGEDMMPGDRFAAGHNYLMTVWVTTRKDYTFRMDGSEPYVTATIGGVAAGVTGIPAGDGTSNTELQVSTAFVVAEKPANPFVDVPASQYYSEPVLWAVEKAITKGTDATHFSPKDTCTRGQVVTFLWRAAGCPEPSTTVSPFVDVTDPNQYYYKAVLWAVEKGITNGKDDTHFDPKATCNRGEVVTFLWRYKNKPGPDGDHNPFTDVEGGKYYYGPAMWAYYAGVTTGKTATSFVPAATCTRGEIVTFLYRTEKLS